MRLLAVGVLLVLGAGCAREVPQKLESPFSMATDSMQFANFADGFPDSAFDADQAVRMFGMEVCQNATSPCQLTPEARAFVKRANSAMTGGRCEGFAVMASLFETGQLNPLDFDGATARELTLVGNTKLQRELAYWFSTQLVPEATSEKTKQYMAKDVMPALADALSRDSKERWRIGIVRKKGTTISGGHALTPIGYYSDPKEKGVYWLRVYDNNRPDAERLMKIDTVKNRWEFEASESPEKSPRLYYGDASNKNPLYLAPILNRRGTLPCDFCKKDGTVQVSTTGGAQVVAAGVGIVDGLLKGPVTPGFSQGLDDEPASFIFNLPASSARDFTLTHPEDADFPFAEQGLEVSGQGFTVGVQNVRITSTDELKVENQGASVTYTNASGSSLTLKTELALPDGGALAVSAVVSGASSDVTATVDPQTGQVTVGAGNSAGAQVTMVVTTTDADGGETTGQLTFTSNGDGGVTADTSGWSNGSPLTGTVTNNGSTTTVTNACEDGQKSGLETDVDCGAVCVTKCDVARACETGADCASTFCHATAKKCVASACEDAARSGDESDVDCGGTACAPCGLGKACQANSDCGSNAACVGHVCTATYVVGFTVSGLPTTDQVVVQNNGGDALTLTGNGSFAFPTRVTGAYAVTVSTQPALGTCTVLHGSGTATADVSNVEIACAPTWAISGTASGLPTGASVVLENNGADALTVSANGAFTFNTRVSGAYDVTVQTQPASANCVVSNGSGTATATVTSVTVTCATGYTIGGTVTGLPTGQVLHLQNNGADDLYLPSNGPYSFSLAAVNYAVTVAAQPAGALCVVSAGTGTATANVSTVDVTCTNTSSLDPAFNTVGWLGVAQTANADAWHDGFLHTDSSMMLVGRGQAWVVSRVTSAGQLDPAFGTSGQLTISNGGTNETARRVSFDGTGYLVVGTLKGVDNDVGIARVTAAGVLDTAYGTGGIQLHAHGGVEEVEGVVRDFTGRFVIVGSTSATGAAPRDVFVMRLNADGTLDSTFGTGGWVTWDSGGDDIATSVAIDPGTQDIIVAGAAGADTLLLRYLNTGTPFLAFGTNGSVTADLSGASRGDQATRVVMSGTNILVVGQAANATNTDVLVAQFDAVGGLDAAFGTSGRLLIDRGGNETALALTAAPQGGWYVGGSSGAKLLVAHVSNTGQLTPGPFEQLLGSAASARHLMVDAQNRIVAVGTINLGGSDDLGVARLLP